MGIDSGGCTRKTPLADRGFGLGRRPVMVGPGRIWHLNPQVRLGPGAAGCARDEAEAFQ